MDILNPKTVPLIFIVISGVFAVNYLRHRNREDVTQPVAQKNRLRMAVILGAVGVGQLLWRLTQQG